MKKLLLTFLFVVLAVPQTSADEAARLSRVYAAVARDYVEPVEVGRFAVLTLKSLNALDKRIQVADDGRRLTLYASGRVVKVAPKPDDGGDIAAWTRLTQDFIREACRFSPSLERRDFEIVDRLLADALPKFDRSSVYYNGFAPEKKSRGGLSRAYADRMIDGVLYIRLGAFNKYTGENIRRTLSENPDCTSVILDLRGNPGGLLSEAVEVSGLFLDRGSVIAYTRGRSGDSDKYYVADGGDILNSRPLVVLIDGQTASSAEVMAAALREQGRAVLAGTRSYGKGTVQKLIPLENDSSIALTDAYFYTPSEQKIDRVGILPDVCLSGREENDSPERIVSRRFDDCPPENRQNAEIDVETARLLLNKNL